MSAPVPGVGGAEMLCENHTKLSLDYSITYANRRMRGDDLLSQDDPESKKGIKNLWQRTVFGIEYGLTNQISLTLDVPYVFNMREERFRDVAYEGHGLGDIAIGGRYWFFDAAPERRSEWNVFGEVTLGLPTGDYDQTHEGVPYKQHIQAGLGQWAPAAAIGFNKRFGGLNLSGGIAHTFVPGENSEGYDSGDLNAAAIALSYTLFRIPGEQYDKDPYDSYIAGLSLVGFGLWSDQDKRDDDVVANTGGRWFKAIPSVWFSPTGGKLSVYVAVPITVDQEVHGVQGFARFSLSFGFAQRF